MAQTWAIQLGSRPRVTAEKLEIDPLHADTVRLIDRPALESEGTSGSMGVKNATMYLNQYRIFARDGARWGRTIGYARRPQFCSEVAEKQGFEPWVPIGYNGFRDRPNRPLWHLSAGRGLIGVADAGRNQTFGW